MMIMCDRLQLTMSLNSSFVPLPKSATPSRIHSNAQVYDFELDEEDMKKLDDLDRGKAGGISWNPVDAD
jgi:diketogulonate reductase-like aldo/keto reductase